MAQRLGDLGRESREANSLGVAHRSLGDTAGAHALLERAINLARRSGDKKYEISALSNMAVLLMDSKDYSGAVETGRLAVAADLERGDRWGAAINRINLAYALLLAEGPDAAYEHLLGCARESIELADPELSVATLEMLAVTLAERGDAPRAALLMGTADTQRAQIGMPRSAPDQVNCERSLDMARPLISRQEWAAASSRGCGLAVEEALAEALGG
jgi:tetratricopeptide (TPR) repeat protein